MRKTLCFVVVLVLAACAGNTELSLLLPEKIGSFVRTEVVSGKEAMTQVNKLHGTIIRAEDAVIGTYQGPGTPLQIWISRAESEKEARRQTGEMVHLMYENPKSPFKWRKRIDFRGVAVYPFMGMDQTHLVFQIGDRVYWLSVNREQEQNALSEFIKE